MPSSPKANSTALMNTISETNSMTELNLNSTVKSLFNLSKEIMSAVSVMTNPSSRSPLKQLPVRTKKEKIDEEDADDPFIDDTVELKKVIKPELDDNKELEVTSKHTRNRIDEENSKRRKRRSISDLVDRYKLVLEESRISSHMELSEMSNESK